MEFEADELKAILTLGFVIGIVMGIDNFIFVNPEQFGTISINYTTGLAALLLTCFGMMVSVFIHEGAHKFFARKIGYYTHTESYKPGQIVGVVIALFTFGWIQFFTPNTADLEANPQERIHKHRKFENFKQQAFIAASGILITGVWATLLHGAYLASHSQLLRDIMLGNIWLMVYSLIPFELLGFYFYKFTGNIGQLPESDGLYILHYSLVAYTFAATFAVVLGLMLYLNLYYALWFALLLGMAAALTVWVRFFMASN